MELKRIGFQAVDAPKTGNWQTIGRDILDALKRYPDFMMKKDKPSYPSERVLGKIYRECSKYINFCEFGGFVSHSSSGENRTPVIAASDAELPLLTSFILYWQLG